MSKPISLFSGYTQKENRITNYCLLIMKMLYEENPKYLAEVLAALCGEDIGSQVGVSFRQQERRDVSIPDGLIAQAPFTIYLETKNYDWFHDSQLENHLAALDKEISGEKILLALGNFESDSTDRFQQVRNLCEEKYRKRIRFNAVTFEDFIGAIAISGTPKNLENTVEDFRTFLNEENLLPSWRNSLDVVNCAGMPEDIIQEGVYMCPAEGGAYNHRRCQFFGMYRKKRVEFVAEIEAVVDVDLSSGTTALKWRNAAGSSLSFKDRARAKVSDIRESAGPTRVFLLGPRFRTDFRKDSDGGMFTSKRYFDVGRTHANGAADLAQKLNGRLWSEFE